MLPTKFWFICPSSFRGEDSNVKKLQTTEDGRHVMAKAHMAFSEKILQLSKAL
jgi:hypothetical protein